jgi:lysozyme
MNQRSEIIPLLRQEEGVRHDPYIDSLGYPTVGVGFKLGPSGAPLSHYTFTLPDQTIDAWLQSNVDAIYLKAADYDEIITASTHCNQPRQDILASMAYQLGLGGLSNFHHMLQAVIAEDWDEAAAQMLDSTWAKQTPERANRHAGVMRSGQWAPTYNF